MKYQLDLTEAIVLNPQYKEEERGGPILGSPRCFNLISGEELR